MVRHLLCYCRHHGNHLGMELITPEAYREGQILLFDKPKNWTSFQLVKKVRYELKHLLGVKKLKVGHAGTLDPLATGLMIIAVGKKTKELQALTGLNKTYTGTFVLGATRPSFDEETEINETFPTDHITKEMIQKVVEDFTGEHEQTPPVFSAKRVEGKRAYQHARAGREVEMKKSIVTIQDFKITDIRMPEVAFEVTCSKGTYIRSLASDFGKALNSGAYLTNLVRTAIDNYKLEDAFQLEDWVEQVRELKPGVE